MCKQWEPFDFQVVSGLILSRNTCILNRYTQCTDTHSGIELPSLWAIICDEYFQWRKKINTPVPNDELCVTESRRVGV